MEISYDFIRQDLWYKSIIKFHSLQFKNKLKSLSTFTSYTCIRIYEQQQPNYIFFTNDFYFTEFPNREKISKKTLILFFSLHFQEFKTLFEARQNFLSKNGEGVRNCLRHTHPEVWKDNGKSFFGRFFTVNEMRLVAVFWVKIISTVRKCESHSQASWKCLVRLERSFNSPRDGFWNLFIKLYWFRALLLLLFKLLLNGLIPILL